MSYYLYFKYKNTEVQCQIASENSPASNLELFGSRAYLPSTFQWFSDLGMHEITQGSFYRHRFSGAVSGDCDSVALPEAQKSEFLTAIPNGSKTSHPHSN